MASQHIEVNGAQSRLSAKVRASVDNTRRTAEELDRIFDEMQQTAQGDDWAALAKSFGWEATQQSATDAMTVYNLLADARAAVNSPAVAFFTDRLA